MALHLNLLHEEILQQRQRQRDPLKIGMMVLGGLGALMLLYYLWNAYQVLEIRNRLSEAQHDWAKVEPKVTAAQKKSSELNGIVSTTKVLDGMIDGRFFWGPFLEKLSRCVALNAQVTSVDGNVLDDGKINVVIEGLAAGREPRAAAEELRQLLLEQFGQIQSIGTQLKLYERDNGFLPTTKQGLQALVTQPSSDPRPGHWSQLFRQIPKDPWGNDYIYLSPGKKNPKGYDLYSAGPDGKADTSDDDWGFEVKVEFKTLEDLDTIVNIGGSSMAMARFGINVTFNPVDGKSSSPPGPHTKTREPRS